MTNRRFKHSFFPPSQGTGNLSTIQLTTTEIADAAIREMTAISLSASPFELLLDQLLVPGDAWFRWISPLGQIRETKTALSGLFGRFVARAYLTRYCQFRYFEPIGSDTQALAAWPGFTVRRVQDGDLPDWIVATAGSANSIAIAEAKGSHNTSGYRAPLDSAKDQVRRIDIISGSTQLAIKRYAIASRWSVQGNPKLDMPWLVVDDPEDGHRPPNSNERKRLARSVALGHFAAIARGIGAAGASIALQQAKRVSPGSLHLPQEELIQVKRRGGPTSIAIGAAVTSSGIIPLPRDGNLEEFRSALETVYGDKAMLLTVDVEELQMIDSGVARTIGTQPSEPTSESPFWSEARQYADQTELTPIRLVTLLRPPPSDQIEH